MKSVSAIERLRSAVGAFIGILVTGLLSRAVLGSGTALPILIAPMGASAVLLFAVPASPLAQPWSIMGGNTIAALVGVTAGLVVRDPFLAASIAVGVAIAMMMALRCLHPPSGAVALTAVLGGPAISKLGYGFVLWPVVANSLLLLAVALAFNRLVGREYPHLSPGSRRTVPSSSASGSLISSDLDAVLEDFDQLLDVDRGDLERIVRRVRLRAYGRRSNQPTSAQIMSRDVIGVAPDDTLTEAMHLLKSHRIKALPVTDESARVLGIVTQTDLLDKAAWDSTGPRLGGGRRLLLTARRGRAPRGSVADIMSLVDPALPETPLVELVSRMWDAKLHHLPVVDMDGKLAGIVSQTDILTALMIDAGPQ